MKTTYSCPCRDCGTEVNFPIIDPHKTRTITYCSECRARRDKIDKADRLKLYDRLGAKQHQDREPWESWPGAASFAAVPGDHFAARVQAERWADSMGYAVGPAQRGAPRGLMWPKEEWAVPKWRNMDDDERANLHGVILRPLGLSGPAVVLENPNAEIARPEGGEDEPAAA